MARQAKGLTEKQCRTIGPGTHGIGRGLYVQVTKGGARSWVQKFISPAGEYAGKRREMGHGSIFDVTLEEAEDAARAARRQILAGIDPIEARKAAALIASAPPPAAGPSFEQCAWTHIETKMPGWRSVEHSRQWPATLQRYVFPVFGKVPVAEVTADHVLKALAPIWDTKNETASRIRGRIEHILDSAKVRGHRTGENPAAWRGNLALVLPARNAVAPVEHHPSLPYVDMPGFWLRLSMQSGLSARALELLILTATRTGEVLKAPWSEFDLAAALWIIPGVRMKGGLEHRVPLSPPALALLRKLAAIRQDAWVFPGHVPGRPLSDMAMLTVLRRMGIPVTPHGMRSTFRTWAAEQTTFPAEVAEAALAHTQGDKVVAAYMRGDLLAKRRDLMTAWADYLGA